MPYLYKQLQNGEIQKIVQTLHDKSIVHVNSGLPRLIGNQESKCVLWNTEPKALSYTGPFKSFTNFIQIT
jgi:hypothetical protein